MPDIETVSPAPGQVADVPAPSSDELGGDALAPEAETNSQANGDQKPQSFQQKQKRESQFQRVKRQKAEYQKRESELKVREERIAQAERAKQAPKKPDYSLADLKQYRQTWEDEGRFDLVEQADKEIKRLEKLEADEVAASRKTIELPRHGTQAHKARWEAAELAIRQENPDFMQPGTPLDLMVRKIMQSPYGETAREHPDGIWAVYSEAQKELLKEDNQSLRGRVQQLESELKRLTGLTSIGGGAPGRVSSGRIENLSDFSKLSSADMLKHLKSQSGKGRMPWL